MPTFIATTGLVTKNNTAKFATFRAFIETAANAAFSASAWRFYAPGLRPAA